MDREKKEDFSALDKLGIIATRSFVATDKKIRNTVSSDSMLAVYAPPGMGKTTAYRISIGRLKESSKYVVVEFIAFNDYHNITGSIMNYMISGLLHELPRRDMMARVEQVKRGLLDNVRKGKKIVLVIDEAHNMAPATLYGLKKLHELGHSFGRENLFSIILFGQPMITNMIRPRELNLRIDRHEMLPLTPQEAVDYFRLRGVKISGEKSIKKVLHRSGLTPLGLKRACNLLVELSGGEKVTDDAVRKYVSGDLTDMMSHLGLTLNGLSSLIKLKTGVSYDKSTLSKAISGNYDNDEVGNTIENILAEKVGETIERKGRPQRYSKAS